MSDNVFKDKNCIGRGKELLDTEMDVEIPHNIIFTPVRTQTRNHPEMENCVEESVIEGLMYCTKCGLYTPETIDFSEDKK